MSRAPSGFLEFICNTLAPLEYYRDGKDKNCSNCSHMLVYGFSKNDKIVLETALFSVASKTLIGPDAHYLNHYSFFSNLKLPYFFLTILKSFLLRLQRTSLANFNKVIVVGSEDYNFIKESGFSGSLYYVRHPYISSVRAENPMLPKGKIKKVVLIGKSNGLPVAFREFSPDKLLRLYKLLARHDILLEVFESTQLNISALPLSAIRTRADVLAVDYFTDSLVVNLATIGAGTANRMLSSLHDGAVLSSNEFGLRNIDVSRWSHRIIKNPHRIFTETWMQTLIAGIKDHNSLDHSYLNDAAQIKSENLEIAKYLRIIIKGTPHAS